MSEAKRYVFKVTDVPLLEDPTKTMQDSVMITDETCGSTQYTAGLFWLAPHVAGHGDKHPNQDEVYYIINGSGILHLEGEPIAIEAGDVVFVPKDHYHSVENNGDDVLKLFWAIGEGWQNLPEIREELGTWPVIDTKDVWPD
jgi:mannose-6-phosphate isomerase-like protein (cupin superfamily)